MDVIEVIARGLTGAGFMGAPHPLHSPSAPCMHCIALHCRSCRGRSAMRRSPKRRTRGRGSGPNRAREPEAKSQRRPLKFPSRYALPAEKKNVHQLILSFFLCLLLCLFCFYWWASGGKTRGGETSCTCRLACGCMLSLPPGMRVAGEPLHVSATWM
jgi:hypothetical protein